MTDDKKDNRSQEGKHGGGRDKRQGQMGGEKDEIGQKPNVPYFKISADIGYGEDDVQILVQTSRDGIKVGCAFVWYLEGEGFKEDTTASNGIKILGPIAYPEKKQKVTFHIVEGEGNIRENLFIHPKVKRHKKVEYDPTLSFWDNLTGKQRK